MSDKKQLNDEKLEKVAGGKYYELFDQVVWTRKVNDLIEINFNIVGSVKQLGIVEGPLGGFYPYIRVEFSDGVHQNGWYKDEEEDFTEPAHESWVGYKL